MKMLKRGMALMLMAVVLLSLTGFADASVQERKIVRVGFPIQSGISYLDENGNHTGYLVDYLNQLTLFTDWEIEYVEVEGDLNTQLMTLMNMLTSGEIDMLGTMNRNAALEEMFLYPSYSYGSTYTVLAVRDDSTYIKENFTNWDGIKVAVYPALEARMDLFDQYAQLNGFTYEYVEYESYYDMLNGCLSGETDAVLQVDISMEEGLRRIGQFSPSPYYFALSPQREDLLPELNSALNILSASYGNLQDELYQRYFQETSRFRASEDDLAYIQSLGTLRVLFFKGNAPFQYVKGGELTGFAVEYMEQFAERVGMEYEAVFADSLESALSMMEKNEIDLVACMATDSALSYGSRIRLSLPYVHSYAARAYSNQHTHREDEDVSFRMNTELALKEVLSDRQCCIWMDEYSLNFYQRKEVVYDDIIVDLADKREFSYAVAVTGTVPEADTMIALLNQYASSRNVQNTQAVLSSYLSDKVEYTPTEWMRANQTFLIIAVILVAFITFAFWAYRRKMLCKTLANENKLLQVSICDDLTGAYNRAYFCKVMEQKIESGASGAMIAMDICNFKYVNDTYGTHRADQLLCGISRILTENAREGELVCRPSADCFYLYIFEYRTEDVMCRVKNLYTKLQSMGEELLDGYQVSIRWGGISSADSPDGDNIHANLNYLTVALAYAKRSGEICIYNDTIHQEAQLRQYVEANMHRALEDEEYVVYLQPQKNLQTGLIDGAEALVRWNTKDRGILLPDKFIPIFEEKGFCKELDLYMLEKTCQILRQWMDEGYAPITISVNQTKALFVSTRYVEKLLEITDRYQVSPQYIVLEILEGLAFENVEEFNEVIDRLHDAGFRVAMDDFGAGYSSLNTLGKLNIDEIKLDRMFLMDLRADHKRSQREIMNVIFSMAQKVGIKTVTEGVETREDEDFICDMGCDYGQGYYYSKPIPVEEFQRSFMGCRV